MKLNNPLQAEAEYIEALIVEPYAQTTRGSLINWAEQTKAQLAAPPIALPARATPDAKGSTNVAGDLASLASSTSSPWLAYSMNSTLWQQTEFKKHFPNETKYRHSLAEEAEGIRSVLAIVKQRSIPDEKLDVSLKWLKALEADGMLECWILLDHADPGIARDYVAYRTTHRDQLIAYIVKYDIHSNR
jgi:hypothetical protein